MNPAGASWRGFLGDSSSWCYVREWHTADMRAYAIRDAIAQRVTYIATLAQRRGDPAPASIA